MKVKYWLICIKIIFCCRRQSVLPDRIFPSLDAKHSFLSVSESRKFYLLVFSIHCSFWTTKFFFFARELVFLKCNFLIWFFFRSERSVFLMVKLTSLSVDKILLHVKCSTNLRGFSFSVEMTQSYFRYMNVDLLEFAWTGPRDTRWGGYYSSAEIQ